MGPANGLTCLESKSIDGRRQLGSCTIDTGLRELLCEISREIAARFSQVDSKLDELLQPSRDQRQREISRASSVGGKAALPLQQNWASSGRRPPSAHSQAKATDFALVASSNEVRACWRGAEEGGQGAPRPGPEESDSDKPHPPTWPEVKEAAPGSPPLLYPGAKTELSGLSTGSSMGGFFPGVSTLRRCSTTGSISSYMPHLFRRHTNMGKVLWRLMEEPDSSMAAWWYSRTWDPFIMATIIVTALQTLHPPPLHGVGAAVLETSFDVIFIIEVILRYFASSNSCVFVKNIYNVIDMLAAVPALAIRASTGFILEEDCGNISTCPQMLLLCVVPILRVMKTLRRFQKFHLFLTLLQTILEALRVLLFTLLIMVLVFSSLIYLIEPRENIGSLPQAMWLTIVTVTTVGYGDVVPESAAGHLVVGVLVISSVLYMAMPIGIIGNAFTQIWQDRDRILLMIRTRDRLVQWGYTARDMIKLFMHFNTDGDGNLSIVEFRQMMDEMEIGLSEERVVELFDSIDKDKSGGIDVKEFIQGLFPSAYHEIYGAKVKRPSDVPRASEPGDSGPGVERRTSSKTGFFKRQRSSSNESTARREERAEGSRGSRSFATSVEDLFRDLRRHGSTTSRSSRGQGAPGVELVPGAASVFAAPGSSDGAQADLSPPGVPAIPEGAPSASAHPYTVTG